MTITDKFRERALTARNEYSSKLSAILNEALLSRELPDREAADRIDDELTAALTKAFQEGVEELLPTEESYDDYEHGSHAEGWNDAIREIRNRLHGSEGEGND